MKFLTIILAIIFHVATFGQSKTLKKAEKLIDNKQYESAIHILNEADPENENPKIVIAKTDLFLDYFVSSVMHQMFALTDLEEYQTIMDVRGSEGEFTMFSFKADSILLALIEKYPQNFSLHKTLGNYYHQVHLKYGENWLQPDSTVLQKMARHYQTAYENRLFDYWSTYGLGYYHLMNQQYAGSIPYFEKSTELKTDHPASHYNLAYAYLYTDQPENAIKSAEKSLKLYEDPEYKADAARMIAVIHQEMADPEKAWEYYKLANELLSDNYYTLKPLLDLAVMLDKESAAELTQEFFLLDPENPTIYKDLITIYGKSNGMNALIGFLEDQKQVQDDTKIKANIRFYLGVIHYNLQNVQAAHSNFKEAKKLFQDVFQPAHPVFKAIESYTSKL